jgi:hypothetical protein
MTIRSWPAGSVQASVADEDVTAVARSPVTAGTAGAAR